MNAAPARVLEALRRAGEACSGEALSEELGVSRAQIWKHVETQRGLATRWLGRTLHHFEETDSTNRVALELARQGAAHGTAVIAEGQTAGRGRLGRSFFSPPHRNLYTSIVLRPEITTAAAPTLILACAVGVAQAVADELGEASRVDVKWPNDVQVDGLKTSGILVELGAEATRVAFCVLGVGVNLNVDPADFPDEFRERATSLSAACGRHIDRAAFTRRLFERLEEALDAHAEGGFAKLRPRFDALFRMTGRRVRVRDLDGSESGGRVAGVGEDGALLLDADDGSTLRVLAGDVTLVKEDAAG